MLEKILGKDMEFFEQNKAEEIHEKIKAFEKGPINMNLLEMINQLMTQGTKFLCVMYSLYNNFYELFSIFIIIKIIKKANDKIISYSKNSKICENLKKQKEQKTLDILKNIRIIKLFNSEEKELEKLYEIEKKIELENDKNNYCVKFLEDINKNYLEIIQNSLLLYIVRNKIFEGKMNYGDITILESYCKELKELWEKIPEIYNKIYKAKEDWQKFFQIYGIKEQKCSSPNIIPYSTINSEKKPLIEFKDISLKTVNRTNNLNNPISFTLKNEETIIIKGTKNTNEVNLVNLMTKIYFPENGNIFYKGYELKSLNSNWLRKNIGYVPQDSFIIDGTFRENILYGISDDKNSINRYLEFVFQFLNIEHYIPIINKYNSNKIIKQSDFTKGQQKLISLGQILMKRPKILILDKILDDFCNEEELQNHIKICIEKIIEEKNILFPNIEGIIIITSDKNIRIKGVDKIYDLDTNIVYEKG
jgi:ABC-type multidrug transport system fused ATPase/permease subunit